MIGGEHGVAVVLDHHERIPQVAQREQCGEEFFVVARMESDRRFVKDVNDAGKPRPDLRGEPDALRFAAGKRGSGPLERQVGKADIDQKVEPRPDLLEYGRGNFRLPSAERKRAEERLDGID
jgi:hypothetical protein